MSLGRETPVDGRGADDVLGTAFSVKEVTLIGEVVRECSGLSRMGAGAHCVRAVAVAAPQRAAEGAGVPGVPRAARRGWCAGAAGQAPGRRERFGHPRSPDGRGGAGAPLAGSVRDIEPLEFERVREPAQRLLFRELLGRYHYLGHTVPFGAHLRYLVFGSRPARAVVGCLQFSSPAWRMAARDRWVGWDDRTRARNLQHVVNNSRFLLLPWVAVSNLASAVLARGLGQLVVDWPRHYHLEPWLVETLVDPRRHHGGMLPRRQLGRVGGHQRSRAHGPARPPRRRGAQDGSRLSCGPGCAAAAAGALSHASCSPPHRSTRPGALCGGGGFLRGDQSLPFFSSREARQMIESDLEREFEPARSGS